MPQISSEDVPEFLTWLQHQGIDWKSEAIPARQLNPTQKEFNPEKVQGMLGEPEASLAKPILVSRDDYIFDGHHRWAALKMKNPSYGMKVWKIDLPIRELLKMATDFDGVFHKHVHERLAG